MEIYCVNLEFIQLEAICDILKAKTSKCSEND